MTMRDIFTQTLIRLAEKDERICILDADLMVGHGTKPFKEVHPERSFNVGVAEANMIGIAAGLSAGGKIPIAGTFGCFAARRTFDQFFISANYARQNVKLVGSDPGVIAEYNGGTHMPFEDVALMRSIPDLVIISPCDPTSLGPLLEQAILHQGCVYIRIPRKAEQKIYDDGCEVTLGRGSVLREGHDLTIAATGFVMVSEALKAAELLSKKGIEAAVIDFHTIKPLDYDLLLKYAKKTGFIVTAENHQITGGLGSAITECLSEIYPVPVLRIGIKERFGQVGTLEFLMKEYELTAQQMTDRIVDYMKKRGE